MTVYMEGRAFIRRKGNYLGDLLFGGRNGVSYFLIATATLLVAIFLYVLLQTHWTSLEFYIVFTAPILLATLVGGIGPGLVSLALFLVAEYLLLGLIPEMNNARWLELAIFALIGGILARLHEMGEMASTLAHELNRPLSVIANYSQGSLRLLREMRGMSTEQLTEAQQSANWRSCPKW